MAAPLLAATAVDRTSPAAIIAAAPGAIAWFRFDVTATTSSWVDSLFGVFTFSQGTGGLQPTLNASGYHFDGVDDVFAGCSGMMSGLRYYTVYIVGGITANATAVVLELGGAGANNGFAVFNAVVSGGISCRVLDPAGGTDQWGKSAYAATVGVWDMYGDKADATHPTNPIDLNDAAVTGGYDLTQAGSGTFANSTWTLGGRAASLPATLTITDLLVCAGASSTAKHSAGVRSPIVAAFRTLRGV